MTDRLPSKQLLSKANSILKNDHAVLVEDPKKAKAYANYLAALGPSIRQLGLLPTLAIYCSEGGGGEVAKQPLANYLQQVLVAIYSKEEPPMEGDLFEYALSRRNNQDATRLFRRRLETTIRAAKLIFKTYDHGRTAEK
ncbi:MAG: type III-B CRISPR module-associated protein Cmr5 [Bacteroidota bacterium]